MSESQMVLAVMTAMVAVGGVIAWGACLYANYLDRREGKVTGEAPSWLTAPAGIFGFIVMGVLLSSRVLHAQPYQDGCDLMDPSTMTWAEYFMYLAAGCGW